MSELASVIQGKQWQIVSLRLLLAVSETAARLPRDSFTALIDLLSESRGRPPLER